MMGNERRTGAAIVGDMQRRMGREDSRQEDQEERWLGGAEGVLTLHNYTPDTVSARRGPSYTKPSS